MFRTPSYAWRKLLIALLVVVSLLLIFLDRRGTVAARCRQLAAHLFNPGQRWGADARMAIRSKMPDMRPISEEARLLERTRAELHQALAMVAQQTDKVAALEKRLRTARQIIAELPEYPLTVIPARILSLSYVVKGGGYRIDKGRKHGVHKGQFVLYRYISRGRTSGVRDGQTVVTGKGVVGIVARADTDFSEVRLITSSDSGLAAKVVHWHKPTKRWVDTADVGRLVGTGGGRAMRMELVRANVDVEPGDYVVTYSAGIGIADSIIIGEVTEVSPGERGLTHEITVRPRVDLNKLDEVFVLAAPGRSSR